MSAAHELNCMREFLNLYPLSYNNPNMGRWCAAAWQLADYPDNSYYRTIGNSAAIGALEYALNPSNSNVDLRHLKNLVVMLATDYHPVFGGAKPGWSQYTGSYKNLGNLFIVQSAVGYTLAIASALLWQHLDTAQRTLIRGVLSDLANRISTNRSSVYYAAYNYPGDSTCEEAAADGSFLAVMSQFYPTHPNAGSWLYQAQIFLQWAFSNVGPGYAVANHNFSPNVIYSWSLLADWARALLPWAAQDTLNTVTALSFCGSFVQYQNIYNAQLTYVNLGNFTLSGTVTQVYTLATELMQSHVYLNRTGVTDWGFGGEFQNCMWSGASWLAGQGVAPGSYTANYGSLKAFQSNATSCAYMPTMNTAECNGPELTTLGGWSWMPMTGDNGGHTCDGSISFMSPYFGPVYASMADQVNTHFFLNSFKAMNHLAAYMIESTGPFWPGGLPNFAT